MRYSHTKRPTYCTHDCFSQAYRLSQISGSSPRHLSTETLTVEILAMLLAEQCRLLLTTHVCFPFSHLHPSTFSHGTTQLSGLFPITTRQPKCSSSALIVCLQLRGPSPSPPLPTGQHHTRVRCPQHRIESVFHLWNNVQFCGVFACSFHVPREDTGGDI